MEVAPPTGETLTREVLIRALETSMFLLPEEVPGQLSALSIPGLRGRMSSVSYPLCCMVGLSTLTPQNVDATIQRVRDTFAREQKAFGWLVGPASTPADLGERLAAAGLTKIVEMAGMALMDLQVPIPMDPALHIRIATEDDLEQASRLLARAYPAPLDACRQITQLFVRHMGPLRGRVYLASLEEDAEPVACAAMAHLPDLPLVQLFAAATLPEHRHRHLYVSLVARRLRDAWEEGARGALVQAARETSAPICRRLGFTELCNLELYAWVPPGQSLEEEAPPEVQ